MQNMPIPVSANPRQANDRMNRKVIGGRSEIKCALELQPGLQDSADTKHLMAAGQPAKLLRSLLLHAGPNTNTSDYENALLKNQEYQTDNAISVVALNDQNKGISRFFKKLTKRDAGRRKCKKSPGKCFSIQLLINKY